MRTRFRIYRYQEKPAFTVGFCGDLVVLNIYILVFTPIVIHTCSKSSTPNWWNKPILRTELITEEKIHSKSRCQLFGAIAAKALACVGERLLKMGCIWCPYRDIRCEKALPILDLASEVSSGDTATWAKIFTNSGTRDSICFEIKRVRRYKKL